MKNLIFLTLVLLSCNGPNQKYYKISEGLDGPPCQNYKVTDYTNFEIAFCVEKQVYLISPIRDFKKYEKFFYQNAGVIYIKDESSFEILRDKESMYQIFEKLKPYWKISNIQLSDSTMEMELFNDSCLPYEFFEMKYKIK